MKDTEGALKLYSRAVQLSLILILNTDPMLSRSVTMLAIVKIVISKLFLTFLPVKACLWQLETGEPDNAQVLCSYAVVILNTGGSKIQSRRLYGRAAAADPTNQCVRDFSKTF